MVISWFSCGADSAVATYLALQCYSDVRIIYIDTGSEHSDNRRFLSDFESFCGHPVEILRSSVFSSVLDVIRKRRFFVSPAGAPCTLELKKKVRYAFEDSVGDWDAQVFGYDCGERHRALRFSQQYPKSKAIFPLIERQLSKTDTLEIVRRWGIELPMMYRLGYRNNNCIGCVKGGIGYWAKIRRDFPDVFDEYARLEDVIGHSVLNGRSLRSIGEDDGRYPPIVPSCSLFCDADFLDV